MYDDDDYNGGGSGLGAAALFWGGYNWGRSAVAHTAQLFNKPAFRLTYSRDKCLVYTDEYYSLVANRDGWRDHARKLERQVEELQARIRQDRDAAASMTELFLVEKDLRKLAEQGLAGADEYVELSELQSAVEDEFMQTGKFDADAHRHRTIDVASRLRSKIRD